MPDRMTISRAWARRVAAGVVAAASLLRAVPSLADQTFDDPEQARRWEGISSTQVEHAPTGDRQGGGYLRAWAPSWARSLELAVTTSDPELIRPLDNRDYVFNFDAIVRSGPTTDPVLIILGPNTETAFGYWHYRSWAPRDPFLNVWWSYGARFNPSWTDEEARAHGWAPMFNSGVQEGRLRQLSFAESVRQYHGVRIGFFSENWGEVGFDNVRLVAVRKRAF